MTSSLLTRLDTVLSLIMGPEVAADPSASAERHENWDSANHLRLVLALEEAFGIAFAIEEIERATSRASIIALLEEKMASRSLD